MNLVSVAYTRSGHLDRHHHHRSLKRILSPPWDHAPFFADVILADVLTSFAKVLGDLVVSSNQIWGGGLAQGRVRMSGWGNWVKLGMVW